MDTYLEGLVDSLAREGYDVYLIKSDMLRKINSFWSVPGEEFVHENGKLVLGSVKFKEYDKLGEGGFCSVYRCNPKTDPPLVYKVLNRKEKSIASSVHRFKREFEIMHNHITSGFTIKVYEYDEIEMFYSMEHADISLEDYIEIGRINEGEKEEIIKRCVECMKYLHDNKVIHRDFHPGNILRSKDGVWLVSDFGLAKDISKKYSRQTSTTHAVGRSWFTDPLQIDALKEGSYKTDIFSLAKTIDYIMNEDKSGKTHKYSSIIYKAISPEQDARYESIYEMYDDVMKIQDMPKYESVEEVVDALMKDYRKTGDFDTVRLMELFSANEKGELLWRMVLNNGIDFTMPYVEIAHISYETGLNIVRQASDFMKSSYKSWGDYDTFANWAIEVLENRKNVHDGINMKIAEVIEYVASSVGRWDIKKLSNEIKSNTTINAHIRALLTYHEGY